MELYSTLGDMLKRRYVDDFIAEHQQLSAPLYSQLRVNTNFTPSGAGVFFPLRIDGNESGGGWRAADDNTLPIGGNERIKQAQVHALVTTTLAHSSVMNQSKYLKLLENVGIIRHYKVVGNDKLESLKSLIQTQSAAKVLKRTRFRDQH